MAKRVETELKRLKELYIIEKVKGPTPWISSIVGVHEKNNIIRICVDILKPNTIDNIINQLSGSSVYSKLNLTAGYHQCILD